MTGPARAARIERKTKFGRDFPDLMENGSVQQRWDAGEAGCGQLAFELRRRLAQMRPGERLQLISRDPGAPVDVPAWCRMTGHRLVSANHPVYVIERKDD